MTTNISILSLRYRRSKLSTAEKKSVPIEESNGMICGEFVMCYPPGIPILAPGEKITSDILNYIAYCKEKGCFLTGTEDLEINNINVVVNS